MDRPRPGLRAEHRRYVIRNDEAARPGNQDHTAKDLAVQISPDGSTWTGLDTITGNTAWLAAEDNILIVTVTSQGTSPVELVAQTWASANSSSVVRRFERLGPGSLRMRALRSIRPWAGLRYGRTARIGRQVPGRVNR